MHRIPAVPPRRTTLIVAVLLAVCALLAPRLAAASDVTIDASAQVGPYAEQTRYLSYAGIIDADGTYAYYGSDGCGARLIKVRLSDLTVVDETTSSSTRSDGECYLTMAAAMSPDGAYGYFGSNDPNSPSMIKVRLSDMEIVGRIRVVDSGNVNRGGINRLILSADGTKAFTMMNNGYVLQVDLGSGTVTGSLSLKIEIGDWLRVAQTPDKQYAYISSAAVRNGVAATVAKLNLADLTFTTFTIPDSSSGFTGTQSMSPDGRYLYYSVDTNNNTAPEMVKIDTTTSTVVDRLVFPANVDNRSAVLSSDGATLYVGSSNAHLYRIDTATLEIVQDLDLFVSDHCLGVPNEAYRCAPTTALIGTGAGTTYLYTTATGNRIVRMTLDAAGSGGGGGGGGAPGGGGDAPGGGAGGGTDTPSGGGGAVAPTPTTPPTTSTGPAPTVGLRATTATRTGNAVRQTVTVDGPGKIVVTITRATGGALCSGTATAKKAGPQAVSCKLRAAVRKALKKGPIPVRVQTVFTPKSGTPTTSVSTTTLR